MMYLQSYLLAEIRNDRSRVARPAEHSHLHYLLEPPQTLPRDVTLKIKFRMLVRVRWLSDCVVDRDRLCSPLAAIHDDDVIGMCGRLTFDPIYTWRQIHISRYSDHLAANLSTWTLICFQHLRSTVEWQKGLEKKGLYYEGIIDGSRLDSVLEHHR